MRNVKEVFLDVCEREQRTTMRVMQAFPPDRADLQPHPRCRSARELGWIFVLERGLAAAVLNNAFAQGVPRQTPPPPPAAWSEVVAAFEKAHKDYVDLIRSLPDESLQEHVKFMTAPKTLGDVKRLDFMWFMLHDEIHHRGQLTIYLRMADGKVPSIYGPSGDEPWF
jgi:uncharacterized damage-inducible protein DinB